jgi:hypothetical protein
MIITRSASGHETMSKAKSSEQHLDISHSSIFFNLNVGSSSNNMDILDRFFVTTAKNEVLARGSIPESSIDSYCKCF